MHKKGKNCALTGGMHKTGDAQSVKSSFHNRHNTEIREKRKKTLDHGPA